MRRIVLAYANKTSDPVAFHAVRRVLPRQRELRECVGPAGFGKLFRELWLDGRPFILVGQEHLPGHGMLEALDNCTLSFCAHGYGPSDHLPESGAMLGLAAFRPSGDVPFETMKPHEEALIDGRRTGVPAAEAVGDVVYRSLAARGLNVHQHTPPVVHLAEWGVLPEGEPAPPDPLAPMEKIPVGFRRGRIIGGPVPQIDLPVPTPAPGTIVEAT